EVKFGKAANGQNGHLCEPCVTEVAKRRIFRSVDAAASAFTQSSVLKAEWKASRDLPDDEAAPSQVVISGTTATTEIYVECLCVNASELAYLARRRISQFNVAPFKGWPVSGQPEECHAVIDDLPSTLTAGYRTSALKGKQDAMRKRKSLDVYDENDLTRKVARRASDPAVEHGEDGDEHADDGASTIAGGARSSVTVAGPKKKGKATSAPSQPSASAAEQFPPVGFSVQKASFDAVATLAGEHRAKLPAGSPADGKTVVSGSGGPKRAGTQDLESASAAGAGKVYSSCPTDKREKCFYWVQKNDLTAILANKSILSSHMKLVEIVHKVKSSAVDQIDEATERAHHETLNKANVKYPFTQMQFMVRRRLRKVTSFVAQAMCFNAGGEVLSEDFDPLSLSLLNGSSTPHEKYTFFYEFLLQEVFCAWICNDLEASEALSLLASAVLKQVNAELRHEAFTGHHETESIEIRQCMKIILALPDSSNDVDDLQAKIEVLNSIEGVAGQTSDGISSLIWNGLKNAPHHMRSIEMLKAAVPAWEKHCKSIKEQGEWLDQLLDDELRQDLLLPEDIIPTANRLDAVIKDLLAWHSASFRLKSLDEFDDKAKQAVTLTYNAIIGLKTDANIPIDRVKALQSLIATTKQLLPMDDDIAGYAAILDRKLAVENIVVMKSAVKASMGIILTTIETDKEVDPANSADFVKNLKACGRASADTELELQLNNMFWIWANFIHDDRVTGGRKRAQDEAALQVVASVLKTTDGRMAKKIVQYITEVRHLLDASAAVKQLGSTAMEIAKHENVFAHIQDAQSRITATKEISETINVLAASKLEAWLQSQRNVGQKAKDIKMVAEAIGITASAPLNSKHEDLEKVAHGGANGKSWYFGFKGRGMRALVPHGISTLLNNENFNIDNVLALAADVEKDLELYLAKVEAVGLAPPPKEFQDGIRKTVDVARSLEVTGSLLKGFDTIHDATLLFNMARKAEMQLKRVLKVLGPVDVIHPILFKKMEQEAAEGSHFGGRSLLRWSRSEDGEKE
ncbi:unnamed protein product, partial [Prorocentrum cordatum]